MSERTSTRRLIAVAAVAGVATAACTTVVHGTASPAPRPAESAGPLTRLLGSVPLDDHVDAEALPQDAAAYEDGGSVVLLSTEPGVFPQRSHLLDLQPGEAGPTVERVRQLPWVEEFARVMTRPDGTVVVAGTVHGPDAFGYQLLVIGRDAATAEVVPLDPPLEDEPGDAVTALSPDGGTLYAAFGWFGEPGMLAAVDVATGEVLATEALQIDSPGEVTVYDLAALPDGGFAALAEVDQDADGDVSAAFYVEYDGDLSRTLEPVPLVTDDPESGAYALSVATDGTAYAVVTVTYESDSRVVVVRDGEVTRQADLDGTLRSPVDLAVDPSGRYVYLPVVDTDRVTTLATVDLDEGAPVESVRLCPDYGDVGFVALDADAQTVTVTGGCLRGSSSSLHAFLVG